MTGRQDRWARHEAMDRQALIDLALQVRCPRCDRQPGIPCWDSVLARPCWPHPARLAATADQP